MSKAIDEHVSTAITLRAGLTMLEVIFAMMVILIGLVAVGLLIPLAGRQAADSYQITQGLASGESAIALANTAKVAQPSVETPWCLRDDNAGIGHSIGSMKEAYDRIASTFPSQDTEVKAAISQNEAIGIGFCIDPLFWGYQNRVANNPLPNPFARTRFPCLDDFANPVTLAATPTRAPRLLRISLSDPNVPTEWLRQPSALRLATMSGGDLVQLSPTQNRALGPIRAVYTSPSSGNPLVSGLNSVDTPSWLMTITPAENTPIIPLTRTRKNYVGNNVNSILPVEIPRTYDVAIVVFSKRDVRDINPSIDPTLFNLPSSERVLQVTDISSDALTSGTFSIELNASPLINAKIKIGDWLMMSRYATRDLLPRNTSNQSISRQVHRWYRVLGITGEDVFPRSIRVSGRPWDWTEGEINDLKERGVYDPPKLPPQPSTIETQAVLLPNVVQVYERQMELQ